MLATRVDKIASPNQLSNELRRLIASIETSEKPSRLEIASYLRSLASRVAMEKKQQDKEKYKSHIQSVHKNLGALPRLVDSTLKNLVEDQDPGWEDDLKRIDHTISSVLDRGTQAKEHLGTFNKKMTPKERVKSIHDKIKKIPQDLKALQREHESQPDQGYDEDIEQYDKDIADLVHFLRTR